VNDNAPTEAGACPIKAVASRLSAVSPSHGVARAQITSRMPTEGSGMLPKWMPALSNSFPGMSLARSRTRGEPVSLTGSRSYAAVDVDPLESIHSKVFPSYSKVPFGLVWCQL
jgi:hypothetical protein